MKVFPAHFVASRNGGRRGQFHLGWHGPPGAPVVPSLPATGHPSNNLLLVISFDKLLCRMTYR